jgi:4-deoxy-L-threo-5-hexosulose-uronate ketol-isomerase
MNTKYEVRYSSHFEDVKKYETSQLRKHFLVDNLMESDSINMVYSHYDRFIVGGAVPVEKSLKLETIPVLRSSYFLERRELGIINVGGKGRIRVDGTEYLVDYKEALYIGKGRKEIFFLSVDSKQPAHFYFNSAPAHLTYPDKKVGLNDAEVAEMGTPETSNQRRINKLLINSVLPTCQLQMGLTDLRPGSVWNTMPAHVHDRRMETYFYFEVPKGQAVCHFMGQPEETRHIWLSNEQAVISPDWSIHAAAGTNNYSFIWGMAGENLDYGDMDIYTPDKLR